MIESRHAPWTKTWSRIRPSLVIPARSRVRAEAPVTHALCVLERPLGGRTLLADHRVTLHSLFTEGDLPAPRPGGAA
ncbi:hypothetical protein KPATCC21470_7645 [Kitasatospora purpeofusca]